MAPVHPYRRLSDHLMLPADALLFSVLAGAILLTAKSLARVPAAWIDPADAFLITMALSSIAGAAASWFVHRRSIGLRAAWMPATGLVVAVAAMLGAGSIIAHTTVAGTGAAPGLFVVAQILGLMALVPPLVLGTSELIEHKRRRFATAALVRLAALTVLVVLITLRFLPETQYDPASAQIYAILGLSTAAGALGVLIGDLLRLVTDLLAARRGLAAAPPSDGA